MLAALASATMPNASVAGVRESNQLNSTDELYGIDHAVIQDASGKLFDVYAADSAKGSERLAKRYKAAQTLSDAREPNVLSFALDKALAFSAGDAQNSATGSTTVLMTAHNEGDPRSLGLLTLDDCTAVGTALGAIHRLNPSFLEDAGYPVYTTKQIRAQLTAWIERLRAAGHVPSEITDSWANIIATDGLWSFTTCPVHGGFEDGDMFFSGSSVSAITNWQNMQVNDPARDLAWTFSKLDSQHRNAVIASYGRMLGSRLDDLIMLRANLWVQMEQVGDFIQALNVGDNERIMQFRTQVERLAHQLGVTAKANTTTASASSEHTGGKPETITVGTLLREGERRNALAQAQQSADDLVDDETFGGENHTGSSNILADEPDETADRGEAVQHGAYQTVTMKDLLDREAESHADSYESDESYDSYDSAAAADNTETTAISRQELDEKAARDALAGLEGYDDEGYAINE